VEGRPLIRGPGCCVPGNRGPGLAAGASVIRDLPGTAFAQPRKKKGRGAALGVEGNLKGCAGLGAASKAGSVHDGKEQAGAGAT
jgi:hypothetical protein